MTSGKPAGAKPTSAKADSSIVGSTLAYESWLAEELGDDLVRDDLLRKHKKMAANAFVFLRASYWRWSEVLLATVPELAAHPAVTAIGDIHLENFGTWRDPEGRLAWGVNDFDEAAQMPFSADLVRLLTSFAFAGIGLPGRTAASLVLRGYQQGLVNPRPFILEQDHAWMRAAANPTKADRARFWAAFETLSPAIPSTRFARILQRSLPPQHERLVFARRRAGVGSLGRSRWVALAEWQGGMIVREAKNLVPSAWCRTHGGDGTQVRQQLLIGKHRAPDPHSSAVGSLIVRRLAPDSRKIELGDKRDVDQRLLVAMGYELANVHLNGIDADPLLAIVDTAQFGKLLRDAARRMAAQVMSDFTVWRAAFRDGSGAG